jgi:phage I-like protein
MPVTRIEDAPANIQKLDDVALTLDQINEILTAYDALKAAGEVESPMAVAIASWKRRHRVQNGRWVATDEGAQMRGPRTGAVFCGGTLPADAPEWVLVAPLGKWTKKGSPDYLVTPEIAARIAANFRRLGTDRVFDYEHQTLTGAQAPAAGWIKDLQARPDGVWARVEWTQSARDMIAARQYRYYSPVIYYDWHDPRTGEAIGPWLHSAALTNDPVLIGGVMPLAASQTSQHAQTHLDVFIFSGSGRRTDMELTKLAKLLGLKDDATEQQIVDEASRLVAADKERRDAASPIVACKAVLEELGVKPEATEAEVKGAILALKNPSGFVKAEEFIALKAQIAERDAQELVACAMRDAKIAPSQKEWAIGYARKDSEAFKVFVASAPKLIEGVSTAPPPASGAGALTETEVAVCKQLGIAPEKFSEAKKGNN